MINGRGNEMYSATGFTRNMGILSYSVEQSLHKLLMIFRTPSEFVVCSSNCSVVLLSGSNVMVRYTSDVFTGSLPVAGVAVLLKNLLISFTFPSKITLFGFRIW